MKEKSVGNSFEFYKQYQEDVIVEKNVIRFIGKGNKRITDELSKELDRTICKYESVSLFKCFSGLHWIDKIVFPVEFNTSSVQYMRDMFYGCQSLSSLDLSTFNTSDVTYMDSMFSGCSRLKEVYVNDSRIRSALPSSVTVKTK